MARECFHDWVQAPVSPPHGSLYATCEKFCRKCEISLEWYVRHINNRLGVPNVAATAFDSRKAPGA